MENITRPEVSSCVSTLSEVPENARTFFAITFGINSVVATVMNVTVLLLFTKVRSLHNKSDLHILSLALGDAIIGLVLSPISVIQVSNKNYDNCFVNKLGSFLVTLLGITAFTVMMIAYDRYIKLSKLERYDIIMTKRRFLVLALFPWFTPIFLIIGKVIGRKTFTWTILFLYVFNYVVLIYSYRKIKLLLQERSSTLVANTQVLHRQNEKSFRIIRLLISIYLSLSSGAFIYRILTAIDMYFGLNWYRNNEPIIMAIGQLLFQVNSVFNPMLYFIKHSEIRRSFKRLVGRRTGTVTVVINMTHGINIRSRSKHEGACTSYNTEGTTEEAIVVRDKL